MKKNQKKFTKKRGNKKANGEYYKYESKKTITNILILAIMIMLLFAAIYSITLLVNFLMNILTMKIIFTIIAIVLIISALYIFKK